MTVPNPKVTTTNVVNQTNSYAIALADLFVFLGIPPTQQFTSLDVSGNPPVLTVHTSGQ